MIDPFCTFVMTSVNGGGGLLVVFPLTSPAQPLKKAAAILKITALTAHTHPLTLFFTFVTFSGLSQLVSWGGEGPAE